LAKCVAAAIATPVTTTSATATDLFHAAAIITIITIVAIDTIVTSIAIVVAAVTIAVSVAIPVVVDIHVLVPVTVATAIAAATAAMTVVSSAADFVLLLFVPVVGNWQCGSKGTQILKIYKGLLS
jgi:hypothetical protein